MTTRKLVTRLSKFFGVLMKSTRVEKNAYHFAFVRLWQYSDAWHALNGLLYGPGFMALGL